MIAIRGMMTSSHQPSRIAVFGNNLTQNISITYSYINYQISHACKNVYIAINGN